VISNSGRDNRQERKPSAWKLEVANLQCGLRPAKLREGDRQDVVETDRVQAQHELPQGVAAHAKDCHLAVPEARDVLRRLTSESLGEATNMS
jgi:hypothetical protein